MAWKKQINNKKKSMKAISPIYKFNTEINATCHKKTLL